MDSRDHGKAVVDLDGLRLVAFGRIPRCQECPRFMALVESHYGQRHATAEWPAAPASCTHEVCAPLVARFSEISREHAEPRLLKVVGGTGERAAWGKR